MLDWSCMLNIRSLRIMIYYDLYFRNQIVTEGTVFRYFSERKKEPLGTFGFTVDSHKKRTMLSVTVHTKCAEATSCG